MCSVQFSSVQSLSCVWLFVTPWTVECQASLSITNSRSLRAWEACEHGKLARMCSWGKLCTKRYKMIKKKKTNPKPNCYFWSAVLHAKSLQLCPTLWDPMDCSPPGSSVHGILQARILEWDAMPFSRGSNSHHFMSPALAGGFFTTSATWEAPDHFWRIKSKAGSEHIPAHIPPRGWADHPSRPSGPPS